MRRRRSRYGSLAVLTYRGLIDPLLWTLRPKIVRVCRELEAKRVIDIASGTGAQCRKLGQAGIQATGVDLSEEMIALASQIGGANTAYLCGSAFELPLASEVFDVALLVLALHEHTEGERGTMIGEALRVLGPEGHLVIAEYVRPRRAAVHAAWQLIRGVEEVAGPEHRAGFKDFVAQGCLDGLVERHGLQIARRLRSHFGAIQVIAARPSAP